MRKVEAKIVAAPPTLGTPPAACLRPGHPGAPAAAPRSTAERCRERSEERSPARQSNGPRRKIAKHIRTCHGPYLHRANK